MKRILTILFSLFCLYASAQTPGVIDSFKTASYLSQCDGLIYVPWDYDIHPEKKYPTICFFHGSGEAGNNVAILLNQGLPKVINEGDPPYAMIDGDTVRFIMIAIQNHAAWSPTTAQMVSALNHWIVDSSLRVDSSRIYATGLSAGGVQARAAIPDYPNLFAASVVMSPVSTTGSNNAYVRRYTWFLSGDADNTALPGNSINTVNAINAQFPGHALFYNYSGGHCCWDVYYSPEWKWETSGTQDIGGPTDSSIYQFMYVHDTLTEWEESQGSNIPPTTNAGPDQILNAGTTSTLLDGSQSYDDVGITEYAWTQVSGPTVTIIHPDSDTTTVSGFADGNTYVFKLTCTDANDASTSDNVSITISSNAGGGGYKIPLSPYTKFYKGDTVFYQVNDLTGSGIAKNLVDEQADLDPRAGIISPTPTTLFWPGVSGAGNISYPTVGVYDLGGTYTLSDLYYYKNLPSAVMYIIPGSPGHWSTDTLKTTIGGSGWYDIDASGITTRYLKVCWQLTGNAKTYEMIAYGYLSGDDSLSRTPPTITYNSPNTMGDFMGTNIYGSAPPQTRDSISGIFRQYNNQSYLDTSHVHNIDSVKFSLSKFSIGSSPFSYYFDDSTIQHWTSVNDPNVGMGLEQQRYNDRGQVLFYATQGVNQMAIDSGWGRSIDYTNHPDRDSTNPESYDRLARMAWNIGAAFGANTYSKDSMQIDLPYNDTSGLNTMKYLENGNENNGGWLNRTTYLSPQAAIAYQSAYYDGNDGLMGNRMGVKRADPDVKVVMFGDASNIRFDYMKAMKYWSYYERPDHKIPFDVYNFHDYAYNNIPGGAISPELYDVRNYLQKIVDSALEICPRCEVWETEWGYDRNHFSPLGVPYVQGQDSAQVQANFIARYWIMASFVRGLDRSVIFQIRNDPLGTSRDTLGYTKFNTSGLTDGHYNDGQFDYYPFPAYYFQQTLWENLNRYKPDSIVYENRDSVYMYQYRNADHPDSLAFVVWSGTISNKSIDTLLIKIGHPSTQVKVVKLQDKYFNGLVSNPTSGSDSTIGIIIDETPKIIYTTVGVNAGEITPASEPVEIPPSANAGSDITTTLPEDSISLSGSAVAGNSPISGHVWSEISGGPATIQDATSYNTVVNNLEQGDYVFRLTVTDDNGLVGTDDVNVTVNPEQGHTPPTAHAGTDQNLEQGTTSTSLSGSATAGDGTITLYHWDQISGTRVSIDNPDAAFTNISGLQDGNTYVFQLTVTDSNNLTSTDNVTVTVQNDTPTPGEIKRVLLYLFGGKIIGIK